MNCKNCGFALEQTDKFCKKCGMLVEQPTASPTQTSAQYNAESTMRQSQQDNYSNYQQTVPNNYTQPVYSNPNPNKNNMLKYILIGIGVAVIIAIVSLILVILNEDSTNNVDPNPTPTPTEPPVTKTNYTVNFKGFTFKIPADLVYETQADSILLGDEDNTWVAYIEVFSGSFNQLLSNKSQLQPSAQRQGYTASAAVEKNIAGTQFITMEVSKGGYNAILGYAKANSMYTFAVTLYDINNEFNYETLKTISSIFSSSEFNSQTSNMSTYEKIDMVKISGLQK